MAKTFAPVTSNDDGSKPERNDARSTVSYTGVKQCAGSTKLSLSPMFNRITAVCQAVSKRPPLNNKHYVDSACTKYEEVIAGTHNLSTDIIS